MKKISLLRLISVALLLCTALSVVGCTDGKVSLGKTDKVSDMISDLNSEDPSSFISSILSPSTAEPTADPTVEPTVPSTVDPTVEPTTEPTPTIDPQETEEVPASTVRHMFTHCLIADPTKGSMYAGSLNSDQDCITVTEFQRLLQALYDNNYCLIDINDMFVVDENGNAKLADTVTVVKGKKPLVFSVDDVTYDSKKIGYGMVDRLVIYNDTIMGAYYDIATKKETVTDQEIFPQLELFLKDHPDFSYNGAKMTLALTGFDGILGYRTDEQFLYYVDNDGNKIYNDDRMLSIKLPNGKTYDYETYYDIEEERASAKKVADWLKAHGYNFACHSYSHANYTNATVSRVKRDLMLWERNVEPLIGETNVFVYPYGGFTYYGTEQHQLLVDAGYKVFCGTSMTNALWSNRHPKKGGTATNTGTIYLERFIMQGNTLRAYSNDPDYHKDLSEKFYTESRTAFLEYCVPEQIYCNEERYYKLDDKES